MLFIIVCQCAVVVVCSDYYSSSVQTTNNKPTLCPDNKDILTLTLIIPPHSHKQHKLILWMNYIQYYYFYYDTVNILLCYYYYIIYCWETKLIIYQALQQSINYLENTLKTKIKICTYDNLTFFEQKDVEIICKSRIKSY